MSIIVSSESNSFEPYVIENVVSINKIMGDVLIHHISDKNCVEVSYYTANGDIQISAIVLYSLARDNKI